MSIDSAVEQKIREAIERGDFENLEGVGKPLDLTMYFDLPEDLRMAYALLRSISLSQRRSKCLKRSRA